MLILTRRLNESIQIGDNITVTICHVGEQKVKIGVAAPRDIKVLRKEIVDTPDPKKATVGD